MSSEIETIVLSLDIDEELIDNSNEGVLFIVHHPLIFGGLERLDFSKYPANLIKKMILENQSLIAMHTNFDKTHLNTYLTENILGFKSIKKEGFIDYCQINTSFDNLFLTIKEKLNLPYIKYTKTKEQINTIAICSGSGASLIQEVQADCLLTGDIKYQDAMIAREIGISLIDIGHFESEIYFATIKTK